MRGALGWALILLGFAGAIVSAVCVVGGLMVDMSSEDGLWAMLQVDARFFVATIAALVASLAIAFRGGSILRRSRR